MAGVMTASGMGGMMPRKGKKKANGKSFVDSAGGFAKPIYEKAMAARRVKSTNTGPATPTTGPTRTPTAPSQDRQAMMKATQKKLLNASYGPNYKPFG